MKKPSKKVWIGLLAVPVAAVVAAGVYTAWQHRYYLRYRSAAQVFNVWQTESLPGELTVMSYNVRNRNLLEPGKRNWYYRANYLIGNVAKYAPDVIGFQEVKPFNMEYLTANLQGYDSIYQYRDDAIESEACPIFYRSDKYELLSQGHFWVSETPEVMSRDWDSGCYRICSYAVLLEKETLREFAVFNTHLDHVSEEAREKGMQVVLKEMEKLGSTPKLLMGDMNTPEGSETYEAATAVLLDAKQQAPDTMDAPTFQGWGETAKIIDFIFTSQTGFAAQTYRVDTETYDGVYASDHNPVVAKFTLE